MPLESTRMVRCVLVIAAPCRHHPRHETGRSGGSHLPRSGGKYLRTSPCRGPSRAHGTLPSPSVGGGREFRTDYVSMFGRKYSRTPPCRCCCTSCQGVSMCSRHPAVNIQDTGRGGSGRNYLPSFGRNYLIQSPCRGMRPSYQGVFTCSRHPTAQPIDRINTPKRVQKVQAHQFAR